MAGATCRSQNARASAAVNGHTKPMLASSCTQACSKASRPFCCCRTCPGVQRSTAIMVSTTASHDEEQVMCAAIRRRNERAGACQLVAQAIAGVQHVSALVYGKLQLAFEQQQVVLQAMARRIAIVDAHARRQAALQHFTGQAL